jgi:hypothetical protein
METKKEKPRRWQFNNRRGYRQELNAWEKYWVLERNARKKKKKVK